MPVVSDPIQLKGLISHLKVERNDYDETKQEISDLFMPFRGDITTQFRHGSKRKPLFDSWGVMQADRFTNFLNGSLYPSSSDWVGFRVPQSLRFDRKITGAMDDTSLRVLDALAASNFYVAAHTDTRDWGVLGNSTMFVGHDDENAPGEGKWGGLIFDPIPYSRVWWKFSHIGRPLSMAVEMEMPAIDVVHFFDKDGDHIPRQIREISQSINPYALCTLYRVIQRNHSGKKGTANKPWISTYFYEQDPVVMRESGFNNNPYVGARMMVMDGEHYGRGRGDIARPVMKGANEITRQKMIALGKEFNPPFMSEEDELASLDLTPGGHVIVRPPKEVAPGYLRSGTDFQIAELITDNLHKQVTDAFLGDVLGEPESQTRSAEAERSRSQRALAVLSSTGQTVYHEKLSPMMENVVDIMLSKKQLPELQEVMNENPDLDIRPEFTSPFFTAQKAQSLNRVDVFLERRLQRFERTGDPSALEDIDNDELRELEKFLGDVPARIFKSQEEILEIRAARADQNTDDQIAALTQRAGQAQTQVQLRPGGGRSSGAGGLLGAV